MDIEDEINILESISTKKPKPKRAKKAKDIQFPCGQSANENNRQSSIVNFLHSTPGATPDDARFSTPRAFRAPRRSQGEDYYFLSYLLYSLLLVMLRGRNDDFLILRPAILIVK